MSRYQEIYKSIRARVRAGERKRDIFNDYAQRGNGTLAGRILCQVATNANRRRFRWVHRALLVVFSLYALLDLLALAVALLDVPVERLAGGIVSSVAVLSLTLGLMANWNPLGYLMAMAIACFRLYHLLGATGFSGAAIVQCVLLAVTLLAGLLLQGGLFPRTTFFLWPKRDSFGVPLFEDD